MWYSKIVTNEINTRKDKSLRNAFCIWTCTAAGSFRAPMKTSACLITNRLPFSCDKTRKRLLQAALNNHRRRCRSSAGSNRTLSWCLRDLRGWDFHNRIQTNNSTEDNNMFWLYYWLAWREFSSTLRHVAAQHEAVMRDECHPSQQEEASGCRYLAKPKYLLGQPKYQPKHSICCVRLAIYTKQATSSDCTDFD